MQPFDKTPPSVPEIERAVLASLISERAIFDKHVGMVKPEYFYDSTYRDIFEYMAAENTQDMALLANKFESKATALGEILSSHSRVDLKPYLDLLADRAHRRRMMAAAANTIMACENDFESGAGDIHSKLQTEMIEMSLERRVSQPETMAAIMPRVFDVIEQSPKSTAGLSSGLIDVDETLGRMWPGELVIIAARPGMGKSSLALNILRHNGIRQKIPCLIFSLEMSKPMTGGRMLFSEANCSYDEALKGRLSNKDMGTVSMNAGPLYEAPIIIDDTPGITTAEIYNKTSQEKRIHDIRLIIVDHMQLIGYKTRGRSRNDDLSETSAALKNIAREFDLPVIALSQLSRNVEYRKPPRPMLSDLRDSGAIEQDADKVVMLYRPEKYDINTEKKGICEIIIAKNRNGPEGVRETLFDLRTMQFLNRAEAAYDKPEYWNN